MRFKSYINEKLLEIKDKDIDIIFDYIKKDTENLYKFLKNKEYEKFETYANSIAVDHALNKYGRVIDSSVLKSDLCRKAHLLNPIKIEVGIVSINLYDVAYKKIEVGLIRSHLIIDLETLVPSKYKQFTKEFDPIRVKSSIKHELIHWIDDSIHNNYLTKKLNRISRAIKELGKTEALKKAGNWGERSEEINAVVNQIAYIKKQNEDLWELMTWEDLGDILSSIRVYFMGNKNKENRKRLKKRLHREGLLGKYMR